jgi:peptidoglycan/xylan/chitin deacetylase (PgdA/CDA1 family)
MYHYVRDVERTEFPGLNAISVEAFRDQVGQLKERYEMVGLERALDFLAGEYVPEGDICLLTFDDGLVDHYQTVSPILEEAGVQGVFHLPTACIEEGAVLAVHKNHFLMAHLGFEAYRERFLAEMRARGAKTSPKEDRGRVREVYRWDAPEVAAFKYLINYELRPEVRDRLLLAVFTEVLGDESAFARRIYVSWEQAREMQAAGMSMGGHTHTHRVLSSLSASEQGLEIERCRKLTQARLSNQESWPFAYPFGKRTTYDESTISILSDVGFSCAFSTEVDSAQVGRDRWQIPRIDPRDAGERSSRETGGYLRRK